MAQFARVDCKQPRCQELAQLFRIERKKTYDVLNYDVLNSPLEMFASSSVFVIIVCGFSSVMNVYRNVFKKS
jgi:hypothetical protein